MQSVGITLLTATKSSTTSSPYGTPSLNADSKPFAVTTAAASATTSSISVVVAQSGVFAKPPPLPADGSAYQTVQINLKDEYGNPIAGVLPTFASSDGADALEQPTAVTEATGTTWGRISTTYADYNRVLRITSPAGLTTVSTGAPSIAGAAKQLALFASGRGCFGHKVPSVSVLIEDAYGNVVIDGALAFAQVKVSLVGKGELGGTTIANAVNGIATFTDLNISEAGNGYKLMASSEKLQSTYGNAFNCH